MNKRVEDKVRTICVVKRSLGSTAEREIDISPALSPCPNLFRAQLEILERPKDSGLMVVFAGKDSWGKSREVCIYICI